jgi:hypothetical protein
VEIRGSHIAEDDKVVLLDSDAMSTCRYIPMFWKKQILSPFSGLKNAAFPAKLKLWETIQLSFMLQ